jgi:hypothetical protein
MHPELVPSNDEVFAIIEEIYARGIRRPAYPADLWCEQYCLRRFQELGLENVRLEPFEVNYWEPRDWSLKAWPDGNDESGASDIECFPVPYTPSAEGIRARLVPFESDNPGSVSGNVAFCNSTVGRVTYHNFVPPATACYDPDETIEGYTQILPFSPGEAAMPILTSGASAFVASLSGYPGDSCRQYVPYRGIILPLPGVWISSRDSIRLSKMLEAGPVDIHLTADNDIHPAESHNVLADLPGADEEIVIIGSHHDAPWASAVEDTSGVALVLAQAEYWSRVPREQRPHRMLFLLNGGHMAGAGGGVAFRDHHAGDLDRTVLEVHLEHAAGEFTEVDGNLVPTGLPEPRWWFTSTISRLQSAVFDAIQAEDLTRSIIVPPTIFGEAPPTDAHRFFLDGVPAVSMLAAPFYLFDVQDTPDKVDRDNLAAITRAAIRIVESTRGETAQSMRAEMHS